MKLVFPHWSRTSKRNHSILIYALLFLSVSLTPQTLLSQAPTPVVDRDTGREMLRNVKEALKERYYDPKFRGVNVGVTPDLVLLPSAADLAAKRDPVLAKAASMAGVELEAEKAGAIFPRVAKVEDDAKADNNK